MDLSFLQLFKDLMEFLRKVKLDWYECTLIHKGDHTYKHESQARMEVKDLRRLNLQSLMMEWDQVA